MSRKYLVIISFTFIISGSWFGAMPTTHSQTYSEKPTGQQETREANKKKPDSEAQDQKKKTLPTANSDGRKDGTIEAKTLEKKRKRLAQEATEALENAIWRAKKLENPVVKIRVRSLAADALWDYQEEIARAILIEDFRGISSLAVPQEEEGKPPTYKKRKLEDVKAKLKKDLMAIISSRDRALTQSLLAAEKTEKDKNEKDKDEKDSEAGETAEMLNVAIDLSTTNPEAASLIIRDSLRTGINPKLAFSLIALRQSAPAQASAIFNEVLSGVKARGDLWEFYKLTPYVLPSELDRLNSGSYLGDPQRARDAQNFIAHAAVLLVKQLGSTQLDPEMVTNESYLWRSLLQLFNDLMPDKTWMVNTRISELSALRTEANKPVESVEPPSFESALKKRIADAESATGARRDSLLSSAAFAAMRMEDYDQAMSLIEKIENLEQKEIDGSFILDKASRKALHQAGPDKALEVASRIKWPSTRVIMFSRIIDALRSLEKREQAAAITDELSVWLSTYENNPDKVWGILTYLDHFARYDSERAFTTLTMLIGTLNHVNLDPPVNPWAPRLYWYPEFHDFRKSLSTIARADFERALQEIQMLKNREVFLLVQVALCSEYLKTLKQNPLPKANASLNLEEEKD